MDCNLDEFKMPVSVQEIGGGAFAECALPGGILCRDGCRFRAIGGLVLSSDCTRCFCSYGVLSSVYIPDSVSELCEGCFNWCTSLRRVIFGPSSSLKLLGDLCFANTKVEIKGFPARCFRYVDPDSETDDPFKPKREEEESGE